MVPKRVTFNLEQGEALPEPVEIDLPQPQGPATRPAAGQRGQDSHWPEMSATCDTHGGHLFTVYGGQTHWRGGMKGSIKDNLTYKQVMTSLPVR